MVLLPMPRKIENREGNFTIFYDTKIILDESCSFDILEEALNLKKEIFKKIKIMLPITKSFKKDINSIYLKKTEGRKESYEIEISKDGIVITGSDDAGLFYGIQTLKQIVRNSAPVIPNLYIKDEPSFDVRGFYHDITRGKVPTLDTLKELVDKASFYKINQLQLYIEHTFAFKDLSEMWLGADPLTAEEILILDEYCRKKHIELVPSLATFGHLYTLLTTKSYRHLCELEVKDKPFTWYDRMAHHTIDVSNEESLKLIDKMIEEFIPLFSSDKFNICCDETFDIGEGKNKGLAEKVGKGQLYVEFLNKIVNCVKKYNKKVMFWGDIVLRHKEVLKDLPKDLICLNWNYAPNPCEDNIRIISECSLEQYVCPGVGGWNLLMNIYDSAFSNIKNMVQYGKKYNAKGVLNTDWGDFGHINLYQGSIIGMIYGAALSWNADYDEDFNIVDKNISKIEYGDNAENLVGLLRELSRCQLFPHNYIAIWWYNKIYSEPEITQKQKEEFFSLTNEQYKQAHIKINEILDAITKLSGQVSVDKSIDLQEFYISARGIDLQNALALVIRKYDLKKEDSILIYEPEKLANLIEYWVYDYMEVWRKRNKESELYRIRDFYKEICGYLRGIKD